MSADHRPAAARDQRGFTLVELLVMIAVLGILAGVVIFSVSGVTSTGQKGACLSEASIVRTAVEGYRAKNGSYAADTATLVSGGFLAKAPSLVSWTSPNTYAWVAPCTAALTGQPTP